ncbi:phospholipase/carboxylesterase [Phanerochaete sordida]|uniref:Acyl-protein thioesterase 1 n=1 Tax=Phanerochaete sordida TaxID=48140 RepID=A0A9P3G1V9_9APHY|nr:phospholipase/carboxylesterase [Phanerochaete sordida]
MPLTSRLFLLLVVLASLWWSYSLLSRTSTEIKPEDMAALQPLKVLSVAARAKHSATVIFVHGLGDSGYGWQPVATMFGSVPALQHIKWVLPHAPDMPVTANGGMVMPSWFDIHSFDFTSEDEPGMLRTVRQLNELITAEVDAGIPADRIILGGFSQGGAMSLLTGLTAERRLGGVLVMSAWLPLRSKFKAMMSDHARKLPVFWGHGKNDPLVKFAWAEQSVKFLKENLGISEATATNPTGIEFHGYNGLVHSANDEEIEDLQAWLAKVMPAKE